MYLVGWLHFLTSEKWPFVGDVLYVTTHSPLVTRFICSVCGMLRPFCCGGLVTEGRLVGLACPGLVGCQALPCAETASCCLVGLGHEAAGFRTLGWALWLMLADYWAEFGSKRCWGLCLLTGG